MAKNETSDMRDSNVVMRSVSEDVRLMSEQWTRVWPGSGERVEASFSRVQIRKYNNRRLLLNYRFLTRLMAF